MENLGYIDELLDRYFEGRTSLKEEEVLRKYFSQKDIMRQHMPYAPMFKHFVEERKLNEPKRTSKISIYYKVGAIACCLLVALLGVRFLITNNSVNESVVYINGQKTSDIQTIHNEALISISTISETDMETINDQISTLDLFTE